MAAQTPSFAEVYAVVRQIPRGRVATYGQIAFWLGWAHGARTVGWAMRACPPDVPWHRVVNSRGEISIADTETQRALLEAEGIVFSEAGRIPLRRFAWPGPPQISAPG